MSRYIDIEPYEKDGWYLQKHYHNSFGEVIKTTPLVLVPTADAEPIKHGAWIKITQEWVDDAEYLCSCCGRKIKAPSVLNPAWAFPYCHCGARMDGIDDGTN